MNHTRARVIRARIAEMTAQIDSASGWGAGVSVRLEERDNLRRELVMIEARAA